MSTLMALVFVGMGALPVGPGTHRWHNDYARALADTQSTQRPLLITIDDPTQIRFFPAGAASQQADEALNNFVLCRIDLSTKYGKDIARRFQATEFPFTAIIDEAGKFVKLRRVGVWNGGEFVQTLNRFQPVALKIATADAQDNYTKPATTATDERRLVLLDFTAVWCGPCQRMHPIIDRLVQEGYSIEKVDFDGQRDLVRKYNVQIVPTMILVDGDREVTRVQGVSSMDTLKKMFRDAGFDPATARTAKASSAK